MAALMPSAAPSFSGRTGHRRSYTTTTAFSTERTGPGAFASLGALPRRRPQQKKTVFSLDGNDDDDQSLDDSHDRDDDVLDNIPPALRLKPNNSFRLSISTTTEDDAPPLRTKQPSPTKISTTANIPFPRSSPLSSPAPSTESTPPLTRPTVTRTTSTPILLSNGKPLKPSLKSSSSSPHIPFPPQQQPPNHLRSRSAPSTPLLEHPPSPIIHKNVHFPNEEGGLATVRVFSRSAKPASLLTKPNGEDTETETEGELSTGSSGIIRGASAMSLPFPKSPLGHHHHHHHHQHEIDWTESSSVPMKDPPLHANIFLESLTYTPKSIFGAPQGLSGALLVRNIAYEKQVAVRFTLDDWQTTSEVSARHVTSLHALPASFPALSQSLTYGDVAQAVSSTSAAGASGVPQWDRFGFTIKLEDYAANLSKRKMYLVARYIANPATGPVESWDNNMGRNYKVAFKDTTPAPAPPSSSSSTTSNLPARGRVFAVSSPPSFGPVMTPTTAMSSQPSSQHAQLVAQTTLLRLKKLNLRNYAAPSSTPASSSTIGPASSVGASSAAASMSSASSSVGDREVFSSGGQGMEAGVERVPLVSSVAQGNEEENGEESETSSDEESLKTPTTIGGDVRSRSRTPSPPMVSGQSQEFCFPTASSSSTTTKARITSDPIPVLTFSSSSSPSSSNSSSASSSAESIPAIGGLMPMDIRHHSKRGQLSPLNLEMGTSPPFSTLPEFGASGHGHGSAGLAKRREMIHGHHVHDRSVSYPAGSRSQPTTTTPSFDDITPTQNNTSNGDAEGAYFPWNLNGLAPTPKSPEEVKKMLAGIREKSTSSPVRKGASVSPTGSGRTSPVKRGGSPVKVELEQQEGGVVSPQPRRDWSKVGASGWNSSLVAPRASPIPVTTSISDTATVAAAEDAAKPASGNSDSIYQAVVRQWCFAQGPSPVGSPQQSSAAAPRYRGPGAGAGKGDGAGAGAGLVV